MSNKVAILIQLGQARTHHLWISFILRITKWSCEVVWMVDFNVTIATAGSIKERFGHYGEITLSDIKVQAEIINTTNYRREQENEQLYTYVMASVTPEYRNTVKFKQSALMNGDECSVIVLFNIIVSKS